MSIRIAIFDDNKNIRNSIVMLLKTVPEFEVVGNFSDAWNCVQKVLTCYPDIILMDIEMPGINGIEAVKLVKKEVPDVLVIIQTVFEDEDRIFDSLKAGASSYILKNRLNQTLRDVIYEIKTGSSTMTPWVAGKILSMNNKAKDRKYQPDFKGYLTPRDMEILTCIVDGMSYNMIAANLDISAESVTEHIVNVYKKL